MTMKPAGVLGIGDAVLDILARIDETFLAAVGGGKGGMKRISSVEGDVLFRRLSHPEIHPGGSAANTLFGLSGLGMPTALVSVVGSDENGRFFREQCRKNMCSDEYVRVIPGQSTGRCFSLITPDAERTFRTELSIGSELEKSEIPEEAFRCFSHVHAEGYQLFHADWLIRALKIAKQQDCTISLDLSSFEMAVRFRSALKDILKKYVTVVLANEEETAAFLDRKGLSPEDAANQLREFSPVAVVKMGKQGAVIASGQGICRVNACLTDAADTTGAGDLWASGFLWGFLNGHPLPVCGKMGALLSSEVVKTTGGTIPSEGWTRIRNNSLFKEVK